MDGVKARLNFNLCMAKLEAEKSARGDQYSKHLILIITSGLF